MPVYNNSQGVEPILANQDIVSVSGTTSQVVGMLQSGDVTDAIVAPQIDCSDSDNKNTKPCIVELIYKYADEYSVDRNLALGIAICESQLKTTAIGDSGKARGIYQFHTDTFNLLSKKMGEKLNYKDVEDNIKLAVWAISTDRGFHWSCYKKITANQDLKDP